MRTKRWVLTNVDMAQSRERGAYLAYDQIKSAHQEVYALYEIARTFGSSLERKKHGGSLG